MACRVDGFSGQSSRRQAELARMGEYRGFSRTRKMPRACRDFCSNVVATRHLLRYNQPTRDSTKGPRGISLFIVIFNFIAV
jgi:hypothetical protein